MNDRLLSFLGLCMRAGYLIRGADTVTKAIRDKSARLVLTARDLSPHSAKDAAFAAERYGVPIRVLPYEKEELSLALGRYCGVIAVTDKGFADKILTLLTKN